VKQRLEPKEKSSIKIMDNCQKLLEKYGSKALSIATKTALQGKEKITCKEVSEALTYFVEEYWQDTHRPTLLSICCEAVGGDPALTVPIAIPLMLISGAVDIHDDIIDESKTKRGRPTVFGRFGKEIALLTSDALLFKGFFALIEALQAGAYKDKEETIKDIIIAGFFELGNAEALELKLRRRIDIDPNAYLQIIEKKAADVEVHSKIGGIVGNGSQQEIKALSDYGRMLGMLIILIDDLFDMLDLKELVHRIRKEHLPLPLLYALQNSKFKFKVESVIKTGKRITYSDATKIQEIAEETGGMETVGHLISTISNRIDEYLRPLKSPLNLLLFKEMALRPFREWEL